MNAAGTSSFAINPFREISLNESADHSLVPGSRKPIFCSTPSASSLSKRPHVKPFPINDQSSPPSTSVSCIDLLSTFQEDLDSPAQPRTEPPVVLHSGVKQQSNLGEKQLGLDYNEEPSGEVFLQLKNMNKTSSCSEVAQSHGEDSKMKNSEVLPSLNVLTTDSESGSHFVSAAGGLEWLIEALKETCLTRHCTVQLERLDNFTVTQLCSQTTYSSCLMHSGSFFSQPTNEHSLPVDIGHTIDPLSSSDPPYYLRLSVTNNAASGHLQSVNSFESSVTDSQSTNLSPSVVYEQSAEHSSAVESMEQSTSALDVGSTHCIDSSVEFVMGTQLPGDSPVQTLFTGEEAVAVKNKCTVQLKTLSQQTIQRLKGLREAGLACNDTPVNPDANISENDHTYNIEDPKGLACLRNIAERVMVARQSTKLSGVAQPQSNDVETHTAMLKEKCLTDKLIVEIKSITVSQLKEIQQRKDPKLKSPTDVSDSASDDQTKNGHQSESDTNHCKEDTSSINVNMKKRGSTSSEKNISSDKEVVKNLCDVLPKRRKTSVAPREKKRRSTSTDRPGTTRKACVSGQSVSRWKTKNSSNTHMFKSRTGNARAVDCSINELNSKQPQVRTICTQTQYC